jgi:hypothetical protein
VSNDEDVYDVVTQNERRQKRRHVAHEREASSVNASRQHHTPECDEWTASFMQYQAAQKPGGSIIPCQHWKSDPNKTMM